MEDFKMLNEEETEEIVGGANKTVVKKLVCSKCKRDMGGKLPGARCSNDKKGCHGIAVYALIKKE